MDSKKLKLIELIRKRSYREGDFTLASGQKSAFYIDLKATTLSGEGASLIGELACDVLERAGVKVQGVGGLTLGADPIATAVSMKAHERGWDWPAFIVRKETKGHGTGKSIEGTENLPKGAELVVVEDVVTTGGSSAFAIERLREAGYRVSTVLTIVDRESGGAVAFEKMGARLVSLATLGEIRRSK